VDKALLQKISFVFLESTSCDITIFLISLDLKNRMPQKFSKIVHCASVYVTVCYSTCAWQEKKNSFLWVNQALQASIKVLHIEIARSLEKLFCAEISHQLSLAKTGPP